MVNITITTFPGIAYEFATNPLLDGPFLTVPNTSFFATDFTMTLEVPFAAGRDFVRGVRK